MVKYSFSLFQIFCCKASSSNWQHLLDKKACTAFFRHTASVVHFRQTSTFMNKNAPNITNTDAVLTGITCLRAFKCIAQSPVTHVQLQSGLCGSLTQKPGKVFYKASAWLEQGESSRTSRPCLWWQTLLSGSWRWPLGSQRLLKSPPPWKRRESKADPSAQSGHPPQIINLKLQKKCRL